MEAHSAATAASFPRGKIRVPVLPPRRAMRAVYESSLFRTTVTAA
jgi:hypothetical protein